METDTVCKNIKTALNVTLKNSAATSLDKELLSNAQQISLLMCDLRDLHEDLHSDNLSQRVVEMEKVNNKLRILAESREYLEVLKSYKQ